VRVYSDAQYNVLHLLNV